MFSSCLFCFQVNKSLFLPDDILVKILCGLSAEDLLRCQLVCKKWNCLISTPQFNDMYLNGGAAVRRVIVGQYGKEEWGINILFIDDWYKKSRGIFKRKKKLRRSCTCEVLNCSLSDVFSYHGLLLVIYYGSQMRHVIFNPITGVQLSFQIPHTTVIALYYHPVHKEYYGIGGRYLGTTDQEFILLRIRSVLSNEVDFERGWRKLNYMLFPTPTCPAPIVKTDAIYWMAEQMHPSGNDGCCGVYVIVFDIKKEEFHVISHPGERYCCQVLEQENVRMDLIEKEKVLSFCVMTFDAEEIVKLELWDLEDEYRWSSSSETIILDTKLYHLNGSFNLAVRVVGMLNGELIISWLRRGVLAYHLQRRTLRVLDGLRGAHALIHNKTTFTFKGIPKIMNTPHI